jgi:hypothetical protein
LLHRVWPKGLRVSFAINGVASMLFPLAAIFAHQLVLPNGNEVMKRYLGRSDVSREAGDLARQVGTGIIVSDSRDILADMYHTLRNEPFKIYARPPAEAPDNYYEQTFALPSNVGDDVLFVTTQPFQCAEPPQTIKSWQPNEGYYRGSAIYAYKVKASCLAAQK